MALTVAPRAGRTRSRRHRQRRSTPIAWLGAGAVTLGVGAAVALGSGVAHADGASSGRSSSSSSTAGAASEHSTAAGLPRPSSGTTRVTASKVPPINTAAARRGGATKPALPAQDGELIRSAQQPKAAAAVSTAVSTATPTAAARPVDLSSAGPLVQILALSTYKLAVLHGLNTPTPPANPIKALVWGLLRTIENGLGLVPIAGTPTVGTPSQTTGAVRGNLGFTGPVGQTMTYTVTSDPTQGSVTVDWTGDYTYTPSLTAQVGTTDTFTVVAANGWAASTETVTVPVGAPTVFPAVITATIPVGAQPTAVAVSPNGSYAYVTNGYDNSVSVIDTTTNTVVATIGVGPTPERVVFSPDGDTAYVGNNGASVSVIDTTTNTVTATIGVGEYVLGVAVSPDGSRAYVTHSDVYSHGTMSVIDTGTNIVFATTAVASSPQGVAVSPDGGHAYIPGDGSVSVVDTATNTVTATISVGSAVAVTVSPDGAHAYISDLFNGSVLVVDTATNKVTTKIYLDVPVGAIAVSPDGGHVYVCDGSDGTVAVIDTASNTFEGAIQLGDIPQAMAISPDGHYAYIVNLYSDSVSVVAL